MLQSLTLQSDWLKTHSHVLAVYHCYSILSNATCKSTNCCIQYLRVVILNHVFNIKTNNVTIWCSASFTVMYIFRQTFLQFVGTCVMYNFINDTIQAPIILYIQTVKIVGSKSIIYRCDAKMSIDVRLTSLLLSLPPGNCRSTVSDHHADCLE